MMCKVVETNDKATMKIQPQSISGSYTKSIQECVLKKVQELEGNTEWQQGQYQCIAKPFVNN